jgi:hypothetical protein
MKITLNFGRRSLLLSAALLVLAALVIILGVIPPVKTDTFPLATPERAVGAFMVSAALYLLFAAALVIIGLRAAGRTRRLTFGLWSLALLTFSFAFALNDAAFAFRGHGPALHVAVILLHCCTGGLLVAALLTLTNALFLPKRI